VRRDYALRMQKYADTESHIENAGNLPMNRFDYLACITLIAGFLQAHAAQTCVATIVRTAPDSRYLDNLNGTVTDRKTALTWKQCTEGLSGAGCAVGASTMMDWQNALQTASSSVFAGFNDWRLPNIKELQTLLERGCYSPALNAVAFPNTVDNYFWSATSSANDAARGWVVGFFYGDVDRFATKVGTYNVRLVRGGP
jgi:hypothetical protein